MSDHPSPATWSDILAIGELEQSHKNLHSPSLGTYTWLFSAAGPPQTRERRPTTHSEQPYHRFVHAFTLCAEDLLCWISHRGGGFSWCSLSVNSFPMRFLSVVVGYALMNPAELVFDSTIIAQPGGFLGLTCPLPDGQQERLVRESKPFFITPAIAGRGTTCWNMKFEGEKEFTYVAKDAWCPASYVSQEILLPED